MLNWRPLLADFQGMGTPHADDVDCTRFCASLRSSLAGVLAADMPVKATKEARVVAEPVCLRWVQSNYSWYNYCDPIPYYPRPTRYWWGL